MAFSRSFIVSSLLLSLVLFHMVEAHQLMSNFGATSPSPLPQTIDCGDACKGRCLLSSRPNLCKRACGSCCAVCKCVPPGTAGNFDSCECYAKLTTRNQVRKCP
ncbi:putative gibberellin regulated protein [Medicago truncatula]|uniref:Gibberellin-regulated family protein n=1 Tax=Medicago truncatula TaxID=3880 RepID=G7LC52_MEDTR|nr:gibberellin-regulated protein 11 [Medicago truncatula]AET03802.1 gibberellin-regulated family protein [Medicago truncatula]RHN41986.1 putative gibberellin regulated protein [Medicago truncatula]